MKVLFTSVNVIEQSIEELNLLYTTAKKFFLPNHQVDFVLFSDNDISIDGVTTIKINTPKILSKSYYQFLKVLSLNEINLENYDYIFVNDSDQMYVDYVNDEDLLNNKLCILSHFYRSMSLKEHIKFWTDIIEIEDPNVQHTMGNFFGGPKDLMKGFLNYCNEFWRVNENYSFRGSGFFAEYPEEILLIKYILDKKIPFVRLSTDIQMSNKSFMTNINASGNVLNDYKNFKLIHNTKIDIGLSNQLFNIINNNRDL